MSGAISAKNHGCATVRQLLSLQESATEEEVRVRCWKIYSVARGITLKPVSKSGRYLLFRDDSNLSRGGKSSEEKLEDC